MLYSIVLLQIESSATAPFDISLVEVLAVVLTVLITGIGVWVAMRQGRRSEIQQQKAELDEKVTSKVNERIGEVLINLNALEREAREKLEVILDQADQARQQLIDRIEAGTQIQKELLDRSAEIRETLDRATNIIPNLEHVSGAVPSQLLMQAQQTTEDGERLGLLQRIYDHPHSDAFTLELAGDMARQRLNNRKLAEELYERAMKVDPASLGAQAEYLHLMAFRADRRLEAEEKIVELARNNPNNQTVVVNLLNFFIQVRDFNKLLLVATEMLSHSKLHSLLWRNIAVAHTELNHPYDTIVQAYETAIHNSDDENFANVATVYVRFLLNRDEYLKAEEVIIRAIENQPLQAQLHGLRGDLYKELKYYEEAKNSYIIAEALSAARDKLTVREKIAAIEMIQKLDLKPILVNDPVSSSDGNSPA